MRSLIVLALLSSPAYAQQACERPDITPVDMIYLGIGEHRMALGDISAARLALAPAADHGSPEALRSLAQTYDPLWLKSHVPVVEDIIRFADPMLAAELYTRASAGGDLFAAQRFGDQDEE